MGGGGFLPKYLRSMPLFGPLISGIGHLPDGHFGAIFSSNSSRGCFLAPRSAYLAKQQGSANIAILECKLLQTRGQKPLARSGEQRAKSSRPASGKRKGDMGEK